MIKTMDFHIDTWHNNDMNKMVDSTKTLDKTCNMCGKAHMEIPQVARVDERGTAFWECVCGTTLVHMTEELRVQITASKFENKNLKICWDCGDNFSPNYLKRTIPPLICKKCFEIRRIQTR